MSDQVFWVSRDPELAQFKSLQGSLNVEERGEWSGILSITVTGHEPGQRLRTGQRNC